MKNVAIGLLALAWGVSGAHAGYESVPAPKTAKGQAKAKGGEVSGIVDRAAWTGGIVLADGKEMTMENAGEYFLPIRLESGIKCQMWIAGPGLVPNRSVVLFTMCGGFINGKVNDKVVVGKDGHLRFEYQNGTFGFQPVQATLMGNTATLLTVYATKNSPDPTEGKPNETE